MNRMNTVSANFHGLEVPKYTELTEWIGRITCLKPVMLLAS